MPSYAITGASRGLGLELVRQLSARPTNTVFALVRNPAKATALSALAAEQSKHIHVLTADVTDPPSLLAAAAAVGGVTGGTLDVLIHNAFEMDPASAVLAPSQLPFERQALENLFAKSLGTDVFGTVWTTNAFLPLIEKGQLKKVVHITTGMADLDLIKTTGIAYAVPSGLGKAGMNILSAKYSAEFEGKGVSFLALSPGWVDTAEGPIPPGMQSFFDILLTQFKRAEPSLQGPLTIKESVQMQLEVIDKLDERLSGSFVSHHGNRHWF